jgi:hypothetical protein
MRRAGDDLAGGARGIGLTIIVFAALSLVFAFTSNGFLEADGITHYLYARFSLAEPHYLVNIWGRPIKTAMYALPACYGGVTGARMLSLAIALSVGIIAMIIAQRQGYRRPALALVLTLGQPLVFLHSFSELTELPFALLMGLALLAFQRGAWVWLAVLASLAPLARPEGFGLLAAVGIGTILAACQPSIANRKSQLATLAILPLGLIVWNFAGYALAGGAPWHRWLIDTWPYAGQSVYASGPLLAFVARLPVITSPLVFPFMLLGAALSIACCRQAFGGGASDGVNASHRARVQLLIAAIPLGILTVHSLLFFMGKMASSGELRYLLVAAPMWGLLAARGWEWMWERRGWRYPTLAAQVAVVLPLTVNLHYRVLPITPSEDMVLAEHAANWYRQWPGRAEHPWVMSAHPGVWYYLDISPTDRRVARPWTRSTIQDIPPGTVLIWDPVYALYNADRRLSVTLEQIEQAGWVRILSLPSEAPDRGWRVYISPSTGHSSPKLPTQGP